jgi:hypothetical protein
MASMHGIMGNLYIGQVRFNLINIGSLHFLFPFSLLVCESSSDKEKGERKWGDLMWIRKT